MQGLPKDGHRDGAVRGTSVSETAAAPKLHPEHDHGFCARCQGVFSEVQCNETCGMCAFCKTPLEWILFRPSLAAEGSAAAEGCVAVDDAELLQELDRLDRERPQARAAGAQLPQLVQRRNPWAKTRPHQGGL